MDERDYMNRLSKIFNNIRGIKMRILYDSGNTAHKKPYDCFIIYRGKHISAEGKMMGKKVEDHQIQELNEDFLAGAKTFIIWISPLFVVFDKRVAGAGVGLFRFTWPELQDPRIVIKFLDGV